MAAESVLRLLCFLDGKHTDRADWEVELLETVLQIY